MMKHYVNAVIPYNRSLNTGSITVDDGKITNIAVGNEPLQGDSIDCEGAYLLPGFIDVHVHGWGGFDTMDGTADSVIHLSEQLSKFGVTSFLPTTFTHTKENTLKAIKAVKEAQTKNVNGARILGVHLEGPYISPEAKGAQPEKYIRSADPDEYTQWFELGIVKQVTVAPEIKENQAFIQECVKRGIVVSIGHCNATYEDVINAVKLGARQTTHTFNGMKGLHHRDPGTAGAALTEEKLSCEVIADFLHIHPAIVKLIVLAKGSDKVILITDAVGPAGLPKGEYTVLDDKVRIVKDGSIVNPAGSLSGSTLSLDQALRNVLKATGKPLEEVWPMTSRNAARQLGLKTGDLQIGYDADFVLLNKDLQVLETIVKGKTVYKII